MPRKLKELIRELEAAGFVNRGGRGSHRNFVHPKVARPVTLAGREGGDAKAYQGEGGQICHSGGSAVNAGSQYVKIVEWSNEDRCFVGSCPGLFYGGCHGDDEMAVFAELCEIVDETISLYQQDGRPLPEPTCGRDYSNTILRMLQAS